MKIEYLELKNFSAIDNAMESRHISIDFTKTKNKICLLIGPNGSGKTTILSLLNPFSDLGNLDVRNGNNLILKGKEGYKEIHIRDKKHLYVIKHFYTPHKDKSHSIKSYIEKDGVELNENGNVTSFKEYVKEELHIESSYLKLIRLGDNVTSLIDLTSTERKNYMSKIMDDIGIYLSYYKEVNGKLRQLDDMISHTVDKLNKLGVVDKSVLKKEIKSLQAKINEDEERYIKENQEIAVCENSISSIDNVYKLKDLLREYSKKYKKMLSTLEKMDKDTNLDVKYYEEEMKELELSILSLKNEIKSNDLLINNTLDHLNKEQEQLRLYKVQLQKDMETLDEAQRMNNNLKDMKKRLNEYEASLEDYTPAFTKQEFESFVVFLKNTQQILSRTYEFGKGPVSKVISLLKKKKNVINYINSHLLDLDDDVEQKGSLFMNRISNLINSSDEKIVITCKEECIAKDLFYQIQNLIKNSQVDDKKESAQFYHDMNFVYQNIITILPRFSEYKDVIDRLPEDVRKDFDTEIVYSNISSLKYIYNEKRINELLSLVTEYDNYQELKIKLKEEEAHMEKFFGFAVTSYAEEQVTKLSASIEEERDKIHSLKERTIKAKEEIDECKKSYEILSDIKDVLERFDEVKEKYEKLKKDNDLYEELDVKRKEAYLLSKEIESILKSDRDRLKLLEEKLTMYKELSKELSVYNSLFDDMTYTKEALSAKKGMPLHIISDYLNDTESITNELLDIAYNGKIFIDKFDISPTEFNIPFYNNGIRLEDVKYASQGELSFLSIALAFALASQSLTKYNIMLFDEMDGKLDTKNKEKFIKILENQIERISCEQCFLITHNNMFSSYPVDIIDLNPGNNDDYKLANFIDIDKY